MSLFSGRQDVYAHRDESKNGGKGYTPTCVNEWKRGICAKPQVKCAECPNRMFVPLTEAVVFGHLDTRSTDVKKIIGLYPIREDNTVSLLYTDFDDKSCEHGYREDALAFAKVARGWGIGCHLERSRSGNGAHAWIFFDQPIPARKARQLGYAILAEAMRRRGQISLKSYDRFFPNQDQLPEGRLFPFIASQNYNYAIKDILTKAGINRNVEILNPITGQLEMRAINEIISSHTGRRTFISNAYKHVQEPKPIGKMSGHTDGSRAFERYRHIDDDTLRGVIDKMK